MDMAFDYITKRKTEDESNEGYGFEWLQAKRVFVSEDQSGIPYGGVIYGLYFNYPSSGISEFHRNSDKSYGVSVYNLSVHNITRSSREEAYLLKSMRLAVALPIVARLWISEDAVAVFSTIRLSEDVDYCGTIVYDCNWLIAYFSILKYDVIDLNGDSTGMTVYPRASVRFDSASNEFSQIIGGAQCLANNLNYADLPSLLACITKSNATWLCSKI